MTDTIEYPIRLNNYLAKKQYATRRGADDLIKSNKVTVNGRVAKLGEKVNLGDVVEVKMFKKEKTQPEQYVAYYKPRGIVTSTPQKGQMDIKKMLHLGNKGLFPIGRLDKDSEGLIILTNDGRITDRLLNPDYEHDKEYLVEVNKAITPFFLKRLKEGVVIEGDYKTKPALVKKVNNTNFRISITEGKKHQIRRMCSSFNYTVNKLKRIRILSIELGNLEPGNQRTIKGPELAAFLTELGITRSGHVY